MRGPARLPRLARLCLRKPILGLLAVLALTAVASAFPKDPAPEPGSLSPLGGAEETIQGLREELSTAAVRLPVATALGALLALRPRRRATTPRWPAVVQTQIVLAIVGAVIMLVVGSSLARAFGIVGVASLIRYRSKIDDPKDAVVMLSALAVGLAAGTGLLVLASFASLFLVAALWVLEGFENPARRFELSIKLGPQTFALRPKIEAVLRRARARFELRASAEDEVTYRVTAPLTLQTDQVSNSLTGLVPQGKGAVEWKEGKPKLA